MFIYYYHVDPKIKATVRKHLLSSGGDADMAVFRTNSRSLGAAVTTTVSSHPRPEPAVHQVSGGHGRSTNGSTCPEKEPLLADHYQQEQEEQRDRLLWEPLGGNEKPKGPPKFEAYMMTGEHILNISRMPQTSLIPKQQKKVREFICKAIVL